MEKEDQHYVPKFHLKRFSYQNNHKQIGIYNDRRDLFIKNAKLGTQAKKSFFYGRDGQVEDHLSKMEGVQASLIDKIINTNYVPEFYSQDHATMILFLMLMQQRNPISSDFYKRSSEHLNKSIEHISTLYNVEPSLLEVSDEKAILESLLLIDYTSEMIQDLQYKILDNKTGYPFITSDSPLLLYNHFLESRNHQRGLNGVGCIGIQILFPLSPLKMIIFYDSWSYKVGGRKNVVQLTNISDVEQLNLLQFLNCTENVYFNDNISKADLEKLYIKSQNFEKANQFVPREFPEMDENGQNIPGSTIIQMMRTSLKTNLRLSFVTLSDNAKHAKLDKYKVHYRPYCMDVIRKHRQ